MCHHSNYNLTLKLPPYFPFLVFLFRSAIRMELKNERNSFEKKIQSLQEELQERENELAVEKKNGLKRDKTIQGLTVALKAKEKENEELGSEIEDLNASLAKAREATHKAHIQKFKGAEDYQALLMEKETLLAELRSENLTKDAENRKLQRRIKRTDQELNDLNLEREKMEKELDEAQLQKSRSDKTINDLRNQLEKLHGEMTEKEKAVEHHYNILLSESNQKLQSQELVIKRLTDSVNQKDLQLQVYDQEREQWQARPRMIMQSSALIGCLGLFDDFTVLHQLSTNAQLDPPHQREQKPSSSSLTDL
ncbi:hypothetical protein llap_18297 [Limosa lapponica baueri]|uniref:Uncharacterized protein n=1 Tax=Limosa lapponica baueri TaxID=1758121 RepID=A0A2I0TC81_LIMLA|nr:hypothetical protein llap_18297 [Limosa lapponica baueri]